jgi:thiol:disulfide interchange protein DsbD
MKEVNFSITRNDLSFKENDLLQKYDPLTIIGRFKNLPKIKSSPNYLSIRLSKGADQKSLVLKYEVSNTTDTTYFKNSNLFFPLPQKPFDFTHEIISISPSSIIGIVPISWDGEYQTPPENLNSNGKFKHPYTLKFLFNDPITKETYIVDKKFSEFEPIILKSEFAPKVDLNNDLEKKNDKLAKNIDSSLTFYYLLMAFIGGLILNVMPCVLPVISIKLFGLIKYQRESHKRILKHNLFYTLGILTTFSLLALTIVILKSFGTVVGWGFQLQSPNFIALMIIVLFVFSLNLFGLFEFVTPGGSKLGNINFKDNFIGDFFGGVLATILSTPCSAPFLGTALTFAFSSNTFTIFAVFLMIGFGLAFPFLVTGFFPALVSFLPKPGNWMNNLKKLLGITLILTIFWLLDVFNTLVGGQSHLVKLFVTLLFIFVGFKIHKKEKYLSGASFLISLFLILNLTNSPLIVLKNDNTSLLRDKQSSGLEWESWSEDKMEEFKTNHQTVFLDFTAKWCFTCKVNEKLVLETNDFKTLVKEKNLKLLIGDWTRRDEVIGNFLMKNNLVGVPAYFIQKPDGTLISLGETISISKIKAHL